MKSVLNSSLLAAGLIFAQGSTVTAAEWTQIAYYVADIGPEDFRNSRGERLTTLGAVLQQDRANVHRFGIRHPLDEADPVFADRGMRARIPQIVANSGRFPPLEADVRQGRPFTISIFVCGYGSEPSAFAIAGLGEDHSGCF